MKPPFGLVNETAIKMNFNDSYIPHARIDFSPNVGSFSRDQAFLRRNTDAPTIPFSRLQERGTNEQDSGRCFI
jgi:hypothetical protein